KVWDGPVFHTVLQNAGVLPEVPPLPATINSTFTDANVTTDDNQHSDAQLWNSFLLPFLRSVSTLDQAGGGLALDAIFKDQNNYIEAQSMYGVMQLVPMLVEISQSKDASLTDADKAQALSLARQVFNQVKDRMSAWLSADDDQALKLLYYQPDQPLETSFKRNGTIGWDSLVGILDGFQSSEGLNDHNLIGGYFLK